MSELLITAIPQNLVEVVWEQVQPLIERVVNKAPDDLSVWAIKKRLVDGQTMLIAISEGSKIVAVNVLSLEDLDSGKKVLVIPITAGDRMAEWMDDFFEVVTKIAKDFGCEELRGMSVRKGWMRILKERGWVENHTVVKCKI